MSGSGNIGPFSEHPDRKNERKENLPAPFKGFPPMIGRSAKNIKASSVRILLVYPEKDITSIYSEQMRCFVKNGAGGVIYAAGNFSDAMKMVRNSRFDLVVVHEGIKRSPISEILGENEGCGHDFVHALRWESSETRVMLEAKDSYLLYGLGENQPLAVDKKKFGEPEMVFQYAVALAIHPPQQALAAK